MVFLPGDHVLERNITVVNVANVARLTMRGQSFSDNIATVVCNGLVGFRYRNMKFNIYSLAFTSYNRFWSYGEHPVSTSALFLQSTKYLLNEHLTPRRSLRTRVVIVNRKSQTNMHYVLYFLPLLSLVSIQGNLHCKQGSL